MARVGTDDPHHALAADDFAIAADTLDRSEYFHAYSPEKTLLSAEDDTALSQIVGRQLHGHLVAGEDADVVHAHLSGNVTEHMVPIFQLDPEGRIGKVFNHLPLHFNNVFLRHISLFNASGNRHP